MRFLWYRTCFHPNGCGGRKPLFLAKMKKVTTRRGRNGALGSTDETLNAADAGAARGGLASSAPTAGEAATELAFKCPNCTRSFTTKTGLGVHRRSAHERELNADREKIERTNHSWTDDDLRAIARKEIELGDGIRWINVELAKYFPSWDFTMIGNQRKRVRYTDILRQVRAEMSQPVAQGQRDEGRAAIGQPPDPAHAFIDLGGEGSNTQGVIIGSPELRGGNADVEPVEGESASPNMAGDLNARDDPTILTDQPNTITETGDGANEQLDRLSVMFSGVFSPHIETLSDIYDATKETFCGDRARIERWIKEKVKEALAWTGDVRPSKQKGRTRPLPPVAQETRKARKARLRQLTLSFYEKDPFGCGRAISNATLETVDSISSEEKRRYWKDVFEKENPYSGNIAVDQSKFNWNIANPISRDELDTALKDMSESAPGLDGIKCRQIKSGRLDLVLLVLNVLLRTSTIPDWMADGRVTLIPKVPNPQSPKDYRPITVTSMLLRLFHKILARRFEGLYIGSEQVAYQRTDGIAKNVFLLDSVIRDAHRLNKPLFVCFVDVSKAFDSCSRGAILDAASRAGVPPPIREYLERMFSRSGCWVEGEKFSQRSGVRQGDPMSGALFNFVIDYVYSRLNSRTGYRLNNELDALVSHFLFADDGVIVSESLEGLRSKVEQVVEGFNACGMKLNPAKCCVLALDRVPKRKTLFVGGTRTFAPICIDGIEVPFMPADGMYKYLGLKFGPRGMIKGYEFDLLKLKVTRLAKSALKPQQKLFLFRNQLVPSLYHVLVLGGVARTTLARMDSYCRREVRKFLHLPGDVPSAAIHASIRYGGLGIPDLATTIPLLRARRTARLCSSEDPLLRSVFLIGHISHRLDGFCRLPKLDGIEILDRNMQNDSWKGQLHSKVDGGGLSQHGLCPQFDQWLTDPGMKIRGFEFVQALHTRLGCLLTPSRASRGRGPPSGRFCTRDDQIASLNHIAQHCQNTHGLRVDRHDQVVAMVQETLARKGRRTIKEPIIPIGNSWLKPDLVSLSKNKKEILVLDPQICSATRLLKLEDVHKAKVAKYSSKELIAGCVEKLMGKDFKGKLDARVFGVVISNRGTVPESTRRLLLSLLGKRMCAYVVLRVLSLTARMTDVYMKRTHLSRRPARRHEGRGRDGIVAVGHG